MKKVISSWFDDEVGLVIKLENHHKYAIKFYRGEDGEKITDMRWELVYYCGGDHCSGLWNLECSDQDHPRTMMVPLPRKPSKKS